jgi:hypothetical protein
MTDLHHREILRILAGPAARGTGGAGDGGPDAGVGAEPREKL